MDQIEAEGFLVQHFGRPIGSVELVGAGCWSRCYGFTLDGRDLVVRFGAHVEDFEKDRLAASFAGHHLPVPEMLAIVEGPGGHAAISTRAFGAPLESLSATEWVEVLASLFAFLDAARGVDLAATSGFGRWDGAGVGSHPSWPAYLLAVADDPPATRVHGWRASLAASPAGEATFLAGLTRLGQLAEVGPGARHLVHGDLLNRNVLVDHGRIDAVFDWGQALYGDHVYDVASLVFWSAWYPALATVDVRSAVVAHFRRTGLEVEDLDARLLACQLHLALENLGYAAFIGDASTTWINDRLAALL